MIAWLWFWRWLIVIVVAGLLVLVPLVYQIVRMSRDIAADRASTERMRKRTDAVEWCLMLRQSGRSGGELGTRDMAECIEYGRRESER